MQSADCSDADAFAHVHVHDDTPSKRARRSSPTAHPHACRPRPTPEAVGERNRAIGAARASRDLLRAAHAVEPRLVVPETARDVKLTFAVNNLLDGLRRYEHDTKKRYAKHFASLARGQAPLALFVTCADSRVVPNLIASAEPGELFVVRNIASLVPPHDAGDPSVPAAVAYAVEVLGVRDVIVCGHSSCGGVKALLDGTSTDPHLGRWLDYARPALEGWQRDGGLDPSRSAYDQLSQSCARAQLDSLMTYPSVRARVNRQELRLHAWWFDIAAGSLLAYSSGERRFVPAVDEMADREPLRMRSA